MYIYVASSWSNPHQPWTVRALRHAGYEVYDFRNSKPEGGAFNWDQIDQKWEDWKFAEVYQALYHPLSAEAYTSDLDALLKADVGIMVMPCGASSHLEIGYLKGLGTHTAILMTEGRPELMYKLVDLLTDSFAEILIWLKTLQL